MALQGPVAKNFNPNIDEVCTAEGQHCNNLYKDTIVHLPKLFSLGFFHTNRLYLKFTEQVSVQFQRSLYYLLSIKT